MQVLVSNPEFDNITRYLKIWSEKLIEQQSKKDHNFFQLNNKRANRKTLTGFLSKKSIDLVLLNGHGAPDCIGGYNNEILLDANNIQLLKGKVVHALSCNTAAKLGPLAMGVGAKGYVGYDQKFVLISNPHKISNPLNDTTANLFLKPAFTAPKALLNGKTADEAVALAIDAYKESIRIALNSDIQSDDDKCASYLFWNMQHIKSCKVEL